MSQRDNNDKQNNDTQHNDTQNNDSIGTLEANFNNWDWESLCWLVCYIAFMLSVVMLNVVALFKLKSGAESGK
jgi:hypothetical protein